MQVNGVSPMIKLVAIEKPDNPVNIQLNKTVGILDTHSLTPPKVWKTNKNPIIQRGFEKVKSPRMVGTR